MVLEAGPAVVVEVVQQSDDIPQIFVVGRAAALLAGAGAHAGFDGQRVLAQAFRLGELSEEFPRLLSCVDWISPSAGVSEFVTETECLMQHLAAMLHNRCGFVPRRPRGGLRVATPLC